MLRAWAEDREENRGQREQKQEHASAQDCDRIPALLGLCSQCGSPCLSTDYSSGENPAYMGLRPTRGDENLAEKGTASQAAEKLWMKGTGLTGC